MKKIILSLALSVVAVATFAQHPIGSDSFNLQTVANSLGLFKSKGAIASDSGFVNASYPDTAAANRGNRLKNYPGAQIRVGNSIWMRNSTATAWIELGTGSGGGSGISQVVAQNGLSNIDDSTIELGGNPLLHNSDIDASNFNFYWNNLGVFSLNGGDQVLGINTTTPRATQEINGNIYVADTITTNGDNDHDRISQYYGLIESDGVTTTFPRSLYTELKTSGTNDFTAGNSSVIAGISNLKLDANITTSEAIGFLGRVWGTATDSATYATGVEGALDVSTGANMKVRNGIGTAGAIYHEHGTLTADTIAFFETREHYVPGLTEDVQNKFGLFVHDYATGGHNDYGIYQQGSGKTNVFEGIINKFPNLSNGTNTDSILVINGGQVKKVVSTAFSTGGSTNSNIGSGYRLAVPNTNNIKTLHAGTNITMDSVSNSNEITINASGIDTSSLSTRINLKFNTADTNQLGRNYIDVFTIAGQSNASGGSQISLFTVPTGKVLQFNSETFSDANDPVGNALNGSAWPSFGVHWWNITGHKIVFIPTAQPSSSMASAAAVGFGTWDTTGVLFDSSIAKTNRAISKLITLGYTPIVHGVLWSQGETDASKINSSTITQATYLAALRKLIGRYRTNFRNIPFYIFRTGKDTTSSVSDVGFQAVRDAQQIVCNADSLTNIVFWDALDFPRRGFMNDNLHYNRAGNAEMGRKGAENIIASSGWKWQASNDTGSINHNLVYMGGNVGIGIFNPSYKLHTIGTGFFTDTVTVTTMGNSDSSNRAASTAWVKRQAFGSGSVAPGGNTWDVQVNNGGTFYGSDSLIWNPVNRHMDIYNSRPTFSSTSDSIFNSINLINLNPATSGITTQNSPGIRFTSYGWRSSVTAGSWVSHWLIRSKAITGGSATSSNLEFMSADGNSSTPNIAPTALTTRVTFDGSGTGTFGGIVNSNSGGTGTFNGNNFTGVGTTTIRSTGASSNTRFGAQNNITVFNTSFNTGVSAGPTASDGNNGPIDQGATFFVYRSTPPSAASANGVGSVSNSASGTTVTGSGTKFLDFFRVGDSIRIVNNGTAETQVITAIASNTSMTTGTWTNAHTSGASYQATTAALSLAANGNGNVGIGTVTPNSSFEDQGSFALKYRSTAVDYTATNFADHTIEVTATGKTITLPTAVGCTGRVYTIKLTASSSTSTVATTSSQTIDGSTTYSLSAQYKYVTVQSNGSNWIIIANN